MLIFYRTGRAFRSPVFPFIKKTALGLFFVCGASHVSATALLKLLQYAVHQKDFNPLTIEVTLQHSPYHHE